MLKAKQKKRLNIFLRKKDLLAFLPTGYGRSLTYQLLVLLTKRTGNYASHPLVISPLFRIISDQIIEVEAMTSKQTTIAQKLVCLEDIEGGKFDVAGASAESGTDKRFLQSLKNTTQ